MRAISRFNSFIAAAILLSIVSTPAFAARLFLDSRPTDTGPTDLCSDLSLRELPRQTLLVIASEELGCDVIDASLEPNAKPPQNAIQIGLSRELTKAPQILKIDLFDASNQQIERFEIACQLREPRFIKLDELAKQLDDEAFRSKWRAILTKQLSVTEPKPVKWDASLPAPEGIDDRLITIDFNSAFMAARMTHAAITDSGLSTARLGCLVRAYANLGESTRELISGQSAAMFARSYVYATRLIRLAPQDAMSWYCRAYLEALHGMIPAALADLKRGDELAKDAAAPVWVALTRKLLVFDTPGLYRDAQGEGGALAGYFAWRTVEHSSLQGLVINFAKFALQNNVGAIRIWNSIGGNTGIGYSAQANAQAGQVLNGFITGTAASRDVPQTVSDILRPAVQARFSIPATLAMLSDLEALPRENGQLMPWQAYASLIREWHFLNVNRQLCYIAYEIGTDASSQAKAIYPLIQNHRYALVVATYDQTNQLAGPDGPDKLRELPISDDTLSSVWMGFNRHFNRLGITKEPKRHQDWLAHTSTQSDHTAHDLAAILWIYRNNPTTPTMTKLRKEVANELEEMAPNHPAALAWRIMEDWPAVKDRADQIERDYSDNPLISYSLGQSYVTLKQYDRAVPLLEKAITYAPDKPAFQQLAETYFERADYDKWLTTWDRYFRESTDTGLEHASANRDIAIRLIYLKDVNKAKSYAQAAANSGSAWGYEVYANVLTRLGQYDEAHRLFQNITNRYNDPTGYYRWCRETGKGNLTDATREMQEFITQIDRRGEPIQLVDAACFYYAEGNLTKASQYLERSYRERKESYVAMLLAVLRLEQKRPDEAKRFINEAIAMPTNSAKYKAYATGAAEIKNFLVNPVARPYQINEMSKVLTDSDMVVQRGNVCYMLGKCCEIRGRMEAAKMWYRLALETAASNYTTRGLAGQAMRKLGEEYYK